MATQNQINSINMSRVLRGIWLSRGVSRAGLCRELDLNKSTVTKNVQILMDKGIVEEIREGESSPQGGRKPVALGVRQDYIYILGLEIRPDSWFAVVVNARGQTVYSRQGRYAGINRPLKDLFMETMAELEAVREEYEVGGIALGLSGVVNARDGIIRHSIILGVDAAYAFAREASEIAGIPVLIENDANCCCWGDLAGQMDLREKNSLFILSELRNTEASDPTGRNYSPSLKDLAVGLGFVLNGKVHYGKDDSAGEFTSVLNRKRHSGQFAAGREDAGTEAHLEELARNIAFLTVSLNLSRIVVGGVIEHFSQEFKTLLDTCIADAWPYEDKVECAVEFSGKGDFAVCSGAAGYYLEHIFGLPDVESRDRKGWDFILSREG